MTATDIIPSGSDKFQKVVIVLQIDGNDVELIDFNALYTVTEADATATARADIGANFDVYYTAGAHYKTTASSNTIYIVGIYEGNDDTTAGGRYIFKFNNAVVVPGVA